MPYTQQTVVDCSVGFPIPVRINSPIRSVSSTSGLPSIHWVESASGNINKSCSCNRSWHMCICASVHLETRKPYNVHATLFAICAVFEWDNKFYHSILYIYSNRWYLVPYLRSEVSRCVNSPNIFHSNRLIAKHLFCHYNFRYHRIERLCGVFCVRYHYHYSFAWALCLVVAFSLQSL